MTAVHATTRPTPEEVLAVVTDVLAIVCERPAPSLSRDTALADIGADSLARVELAELLEQRLTAYVPELHIPDAELEAFRTVGDAADYVTGRMR
jgi:acyl carrier protein